MKIAIAASEAYPFSKTGGLADVTGSMFKEFNALGIDTVLFVPLYKTTKQRFSSDIEDTGIEFQVKLADVRGLCRIYKKKNSGKGVVYFIGNDDMFGRDELYGTATHDYPDNDVRFIFFCRSILEFCIRRQIYFDIIHCNDWQTGLIPLLLRTIYKNEAVFSHTKSVFTIHNLGFQGIFPPHAMNLTGLGWELFNPEGPEFYGNLNLLKAGIVGADVLTTVSETYAREILTHEFGAGMEGILRKRSDILHGILNGIDYDEWNPSTDRFLPSNYSVENLSGKISCKKALTAATSLKRDADAPLICFIGRLTHQKGIDLLVQVLPEVIALGAMIVVIGRGEEQFHQELFEIRSRFQDALFLHIGFDEPLAHLTYAGADLFLMPSAYEPCGLGQMIAMRYGTIPLGRKTGGLSDTIQDAGDMAERFFCERLLGEIKETGFLFTDYSAQALSREIKKALCLYYNRLPWLKLMRNAMSRDLSWTQSAKKYLEIYSSAQS